MVNHSNSSISVKVPHRKTKGKTKAKHTMIAALIARGFSVKDVAQKVNLSESQIYHLLSDKDSFVNAEIFRILSELFTENDRHLVDLLSKALQKLHNMLSSSDEEKQFRAIDRIIKIYLSRSAKNAVTIQQYFGIQSQQDENDFIKNIDDLIIKMRKERGLPWPLDDKENSDSTPNDSSDSSSHDSSSHDSSPDNPSTDNSHPDAPSPDTSSPAFRAFLESIE
jgi:transcriptional regulator with XRE-family HTH domain